ncbi:MAG: FMN-binding glutamate synthase family protein [Bacteroidota bacterium]
MRSKFLVTSLALCLLLAAIGYFYPRVLWAFIIVGPLVILGWRDAFQESHAILRNYPIVGHFRYLFESIRPEMMQYFVETDTEGRPINRIIRSLVYRRAKNISDTNAFGTQLNVQDVGYEWINHSIYAKDAHGLNQDPRITIGGKDCKQPYSTSLLNISAMSFGSLSNRAIEALNFGAAKGNFFHNTGEGGVSPYHLKYGGDLCWQIGTGYFGARAKDGNFSPERYKETVSHSNVKLVELKLSQGAKPGHGGILPAKKNTKEIAQIRGVEPHTTVASPPYHKAFSNAVEMMHFIKKLRDLSDGKPIGFKLCVGKKEEFVDICKAIVQTGIKPDFIAVDGGEGGTGAAPVEFSDSVGMPLNEGLNHVYNTLVAFNLKEDIKIIASGKMTSAFHMAGALALGADICNSARAMMLALGCIQALQCNKNTCPTGVATQDKSLIKGLDVDDKGDRVFHYHRRTIEALIEITAAAGFERPQEITKDSINRRISPNQVMTFEQIYPSLSR